MRHRCSLLLLCLLAPATATAATYYVAPTGSDLATGSSLAPWATLAHANATLRPGDLCMLRPGSYVDAIHPARAGSAVARITYLGDLAHPERVTVAQVLVDQRWVSVKGVTAPAGTLAYEDEITAARFDSLAWCTFSGGIGFVGAKDCVIAHCTVLGAVQFAGDHWLPVGQGVSSCERDTLSANTIIHGSVADIGGQRAFKLMHFTQRCVIDSNQVTGIFGGANSDLFGTLIYNSYRNVFHDNHWSWEAIGPRPNGEPWDAFSVRDSSSHNLFLRDTLLCGTHGTLPMRTRFCSAGTYPGQCVGNVWRSCLFKMTAYLWGQDRMDSSVVESCTVVSKGAYAMYLESRPRAVAWRHNTFATLGTVALECEATLTDGGNDFRSNIFYAAGAPTCETAIARFTHTGGFTSDHNLYYAPDAGNVADHALGGEFGCSAPGTSGLWYATLGQDGGSRFGAPLFADSSFDTFDGRLRAGSMAVGVGDGGSIAGAAGLIVVGPVVTDLRTAIVRPDTVTLSWSAPSLSGAAATAYDLRFATTPLTASTFGTGIPIAAPGPAAPGTTQRAGRGGLVPGHYYFALRVRDTAGVWGPPGNVAEADLQPPAAVRDLH